MNNMGTENVYNDIQAMSLPVRYIKKKQPVKNTVKTPMNFVPTNLVTSKKIPSHINIQKTVIEQPYNLNKEKQEVLKEHQNNLISILVVDKFNINL